MLRSARLVKMFFESTNVRLTLPQKWWRRYKYPVFQIRLGNTRAVVVNSFDACKQMLIGNQSAVVDRPTLYTFHGVISSTKGFTIGSSPWDESCKVNAIILRWLVRVLTVSLEQA